MRFKQGLIALIIVGFLSYSNGFAAAKDSHLYVLWEGLEPDKCAVVWLVKRYVDKEAVFKFVRKGTIITEGIQLDTPDSKIQRKQNLSAFEVALIEYKLNNPILKRIGKIVWDIEINNSNRATNISRATFEENLVEGGWVKTTSKDGLATIYEKGGARYVVRNNATSTDGPTADYYPPGNDSINLKIRLEE